jgi:hypothetical protein
MTTKNTALIALDYPIERGEDKKPIEVITLRRPKTGDILKLVKLFGPEIAGFMSDGDREKLIDSLKAQDGESGGGDLAKYVAAMLAPDKLDSLAEIVADLFGITGEDVLGIDPADYPEIWKALSGFFPGLTLETLKPGETAPEISPSHSDGPPAQSAT